METGVAVEGASDGPSRLTVSYLSVYTHHPQTHQPRTSDVLNALADRDVRTHDRTRLLLESMRTPKTSQSDTLLKHTLTPTWPSRPLYSLNTPSHHEPPWILTSHTGALRPTKHSTLKNWTDGSVPVTLPEFLPIHLPPDSRSSEETVPRQTGTHRGLPVPVTEPGVGEKGGFGTRIETADGPHLGPEEEETLNSFYRLDSGEENPGPHPHEF